MNLLLVRRTLMALMLAGGVVLLASHPVGAGAQAPRPNIVLMMTDDQGWEETGYNGHPFVKTPTLDQVVAEGLRFDRFYAGAPNCGPTRGSIMTGRNSNRFGLFQPNDAIRPEEVTLAQILQRAGYATGHFGKWHLGAVKAESPNNPGRMGFDAWLSHDNFFEMDPVFSRNGAPPEKLTGESSMLVADAALDFIRQGQSASRPFFVLLWFGSPHSPYLALPEDEALYSEVENENQRRRFAEITAMDRAVGHFRDELRRLNLRDNTLLWWQSDNGVPSDGFTGLYEPKLRGAKNALYENGIRVPAIIEWPARIVRPRTTSVPVVTHDMMPTILDLLGLPIPSNRPLDGVSMRALLEGQVTERSTPVGGFWSRNWGQQEQGERWIPAELQKGTTPTARNPGIDFRNFRYPAAQTSDFVGTAAWMTNDYKLVVPAGGQPELYHIPNDQAEKNNLAALHPDVVERLLKDLHAWQASVEVSLTGADYMK